MNTIEDLAALAFRHLRGVWGLGAEREPLSIELDDEDVLADLRYGRGEESALGETVNRT